MSGNSKLIPRFSSSRCAVRKFSGPRETPDEAFEFRGVQTFSAHGSQETSRSGISVDNKNRHTVPHAFVKSRRSENVDVPFGRFVQCSARSGYVINAFELYQMLNQNVQNCSGRDNRAMRGRIALQKHFVQNLIKRLLFREALGCFAKLWECARVLASLCMMPLTAMYRTRPSTLGFRSAS